MVESFTNFQREMWHMLAKCGMCRYYIDIDKNGCYVIRKAQTGVILFWILWCNNICKFVYQVLTYHGLLGIPVHFLDQISIIDWFLMCGHVVFECIVWFFKYPMFENLHRQWELQEEIFRKLGRPAKAPTKITRTDRMNFYIYGGICIVGTFALAVQFFTNPKYALNTYAIIPWDNLPLRIVFCIHECLFMCHTYAYQAFTMVIAESYAVSYQHILEEMNEAVGSITVVTRNEGNSANSKVNASLGASMVTDNSNGKPSQTTSKTSKVDESLSTTPKFTAPRTQYDISSLVDDYRKIMISSQFHNEWIGKLMGYSAGINYAQFVSDVFMLIQLLKENDTDYFGVVFYAMDAAFGMIMIFRMLIILSRLYPQAEEFIRGLKIYSTLNKPGRKELLKIMESLKLVSAKLTGHSVTPCSVPKGVNALINWYIAAALWKRPEDPTRRT